MLPYPLKAKGRRSAKTWARGADETRSEGCGKRGNAKPGERQVRSSSARSRWLRGALIVLLAFAADQAAGQPGTAPAAETEAQLRARYDTLFQRILSDPGDLDASFEFAMLAARLGEYEAAISTLERMLIFNPALPRVRLELGALYFRIGAYAVAESYFAQVAGDPSAPPAVKQRVTEFRERIEARSARDQFSGQVAAGLRYQTNANGGPADATVRVLGLEGELDREFTAQEDYNWFASAVVRHAYDLDTRTGSWFETVGQLYVARQFEQTRVDLTFLQLTTGPRLALSEEGMRGPTIRPYGVHSYVELDGRRFYVEGGGGVELDFPLDRIARLSVGSQLVYQDHGLPWQDRDGAELLVEAGLSLQPRDALQFGVNGWLLHDDSRVAFEERNEVAGFATAALSLDTGGGWLAGPLLIRPFAGLVSRRYDAADPTVDPTTARADLETRLGVVTTLQIDEALGLQLSASHADNRSNLPNFTYENQELSLSLFMRF